MNRLNNPDVAQAFAPDTTPFQFPASLDPELRRSSPTNTPTNTAPRKWWQLSWSWSWSLFSLIAFVATLFICGHKIWSHARDFDTTSLAVIEQTLASDDYAEFLSDHSLRLHLSDQTLTELGLQALPAPENAAPSLSDQRQSLASLHSWHDHLRHLLNRTLILLILGPLAPYLLRLWLSLFPRNPQS